MHLPRCAGVIISVLLSPTSSSEWALNYTVSTSDSERAYASWSFYFHFINYVLLGLYEASLPELVRLMDMPLSTE